MRFDCINLVEDGKEVYLEKKPSPKANPDTNKTSPNASIKALESNPVKKPIILKRDLNRNFDEKTVNGKNVVQVNIENADLSHSLKFRSFLRKVIEHKTKQIVVDLSFVKRVDLSFIGVLVEGLKKSARYGGSIVLIANTNLMLSSFILLNLDMLFISFKNIDETMNYFESGINKAA